MEPSMEYTSSQPRGGVSPSQVTVAVAVSGSYSTFTSVAAAHSSFSLFKGAKAAAAAGVATPPTKKAIRMKRALKTYLFFMIRDLGFCFTARIPNIPDEPLIGVSLLCPFPSLDILKDLTTMRYKSENHW